MSVPRLHPDTLAQLPGAVRRPAYDRSACGIGVVHLGLGNFHRAHQAVYFDDVLAEAGGDWRVLGVSCRSPAVSEQLVPQQGLYSLAVAGSQGCERRVIGAIADVLVAPRDPVATCAALADARTRIVTLTITEKGYCRDAASGRLDASHPDIVHDLSAAGTPRSALGLLLDGLAARAGHGAPITVLSCDNLPHNGATLRDVLLDLAQRRDASLARWIDGRVAFPSSMVDRIVPATTAEDLQEAQAALGVLDAGVVRTEPFTQWVVEDRFAAGRPALERVGVQMVADVRPFELAKLRLLNGSHSTLAYVGGLLDLPFVHEAVADADLLHLLQRLMRDELAPTLPAVPGLDTTAYAAALLQRFANPTLRHRLAQIAMDGSQKLPQRLLQPLQERLLRGEDVRHLTFVVASWMAYAHDRRLDDPLAERIAGCHAAGADDAQRTVAALLELKPIFGDVLPMHQPWCSQLLDHYRALRSLGPRAALQRLLHPERP